MKLLREIFNQSYPVKHEKSQTLSLGGNNKMTSHYHSFQSPNNKYLIIMDHYHKKGTLDVAFHSKSGGGSTKITGKEGSEAHKVFGTVRNHVMSHMKANPDIKKVTFSGAKDGDGSRNRLYTALARSSGGKTKEIDDGSGKDYEVNR